MIAEKELDKPNMLNYKYDTFLTGWPILFYYNNISCLLTINFYKYTYYEYYILYPILIYPKCINTINSLSILRLCNCIEKIIKFYVDIIGWNNWIHYI